MRGISELFHIGVMRDSGAMVENAEENVLRLRLVRIAMNVIHSKLDSSPLDSVLLLLELAISALLQLPTRPRPKEVMTGHHNTPKGMSCAQKLFTTHSGPSKQVSCCYLVWQQQDHRLTTLPPSYGVSLSSEVSRHACRWP